MFDTDYLQRVIDEAVVNVTRKVAKLSLSPCDSEECRCTDGKCDIVRISVTDTDGSVYSLYYRTQPHMLRAIAERMKRAPIEDDEDLAVYVKEYINILCGNVVSRINKDMKLGMRFGLPSYPVESTCLHEDLSLNVCYECPSENGMVSIAGINQLITGNSA